MGRRGTREREKESRKSESPDSISNLFQAVKWRADYGWKKVYIECPPLGRAEMNVKVYDSPEFHDVAFIRNKLAEYNRIHVEDDNHKPLTVISRAAEGTILGGLLGGTYWGWLHVDYLWVDSDHRREGIGTLLLKAAEVEALT